MLKRVLRRFLPENKFEKVLIILLSIAIFSARVFFLSIFPVGIDHDTTDLILSAESIFKFGKDISGVPFYKILFFSNTEAHQAGFASLLLSPFLEFLAFLLF